MATNKVFTLTIDGVETAIKNTTQLKESIEQLEAQFEGAEFGTAQYQALQRELQRANSEMEKIEISVEKFTPEQKFQTIAGLTEAMAGGFGLVTTAAAAFGEELGLSEEEVKKYEDAIGKVQLAVTSFIAIGQAFSGENLKNLRSLLALTGATKQQAAANTQAAATAAESAAATQAQGAAAVGATAATEGATVATRTFGVTLKTALATLGIPLLIGLLYTLYENWDKVKSATIAAFDAVKTNQVVRFLFPIIPLVDQISEKFGSLKQFIYGIGGAVSATFKGIGKVLSDVVKGDFSDAIADAKALGATIQKGVQDGINSAKQEENQDADEKKTKALIENLGRQIKLREAAGRDTYELEKRLGEAKLSLLKQETEDEKKTYLDAQNDLEALRISHEKEVAEKRKESAEKAKQEREKREKEAFDSYKEGLQRQQEELDAIDKRNGGTQTRKVKVEFTDVELPKTLPIIPVKVVPQTTDDDISGLAVRLQQGLEDGLLSASEDGSFTSEFFDSIFGEGGDQLVNNLASLEDSIFTPLREARMEGLEKGLSDIEGLIGVAQERVDGLSQELQNSQKSIDDLEQQLVGAKGAAREAIIQKLEQERGKQAQLAAEKKKEDDRIKKAENDKIELERKMQKEREKTNKIAAAAALIDKTVTAGLAVQAAVKATVGANSVPFPGNLAAIVAALAATAGAIASAKSFASGFAEGGYTGDGGKYEAAGIVHRGEYVVPQHIVKNPAFTGIIGQLESARMRGFSDGGPVDISSINQDSRKANLLMQELLVLRSDTNTLAAAISERPVIVAHSEYRDYESKITQIQEYSLN